MIKVENKHFYKGPGIYIGRGSILGNPFRIVPGNVSREEAIEKYKVFFSFEMTANRVFYDFVRSLITKARIDDLTLICWCAPKPCHGDFIKSFIEEQIL